MKQLSTFIACFVLGGSLAANATTIRPLVPIVDTSTGGGYTTGDTFVYLTYTSPG